MNIENMHAGSLVYPEVFECECGKTHSSTLRFVEISTGAVTILKDKLREFGFKKVQIYADKNTWQAAGEKVLSALHETEYILYRFQDREITANDSCVGQAVLNFNYSVDAIIAVGTGTVNDISKIVSRISGKPYIIVGTAPSMDGFASDTSSMVVDGLKLSVSTTSPLGIILDTDILKEAPMRLICSGVGDLAAKYISIAEWRISHIINDEYYCPHIAQMMMNSVNFVMENLEGIKNRDEKAIAGLAEGLVLSGMAMSFAGVTRPASGMEHYFSHIWEMRALEYGYKEYLHGEQVGIGTLLALKVYEKLQEVVPDRERTKEYVYSFSLEKWHEHLREFLGNSSKSMILQEKRENKYLPSLWENRIENIVKHWDRIMEIIKSLPSSEEIYEKFRYIGALTDISEVEIGTDVAKDTFLATKDIRDKYIGTRLLFDLGLIDEFAGELF